MAYWVKADGTVAEVFPASDDGKFTLEELQKFVGGYIEYVKLGANEYMVCNEEGLIANLPFNDAASLRHPNYCGGVPLGIRGDVVIGTKKEVF